MSLSETICGEAICSPADRMAVGTAESADASKSADTAAAAHPDGDVAARSNRPATRGASKPVERFSESKHSTFSAYELSRLDARHDRVRDVSYAEATQKLEETGLQAEAWLHEVRRIVTQMDIILNEIPLEQAAAAQALRMALMEMVDEAGDEEEGEEGETCARCEEIKPTEAERVAAAYFQEVSDAVGWSKEGMPLSAPLSVLKASHNGCAGGLMLTRFELMWIKAGCHFSEAKVRIPLRQIERSSISRSKSPFGSSAEFVIVAQGVTSLATGTE